MYPKPNPSLVSGSALAALLTAAFAASASAATFAAVGLYDTTATANAVDTNANGEAIGSTTPTAVAGFTANVLSAFNAGRGGVVNFDTGAADVSLTVASGSPAGFTVTYAGGTKSFDVTVDRAVRTAAYTSAATISGGNGLDLPNNIEGSQTFILTFGAITGASPGEVISSIALTALSRTIASGPEINVTMLATFSGGGNSSLTSGLTATSTADDTFYGFVAPAGQSITSLTVTRSGRVPFDDLGFITIPEPSSALLGLGGLAFLATRRRRA